MHIDYLAKESYISIYTVLLENEQLSDATISLCVWVCVGVCGGGGGGGGVCAHIEMVWRCVV